MGGDQEQERDPKDMAHREKWWHECEVGEKLERMRAIVKIQGQEINRLHEVIAHLTANFDHHIHVDGKIAYTRNNRPLGLGGGPTITGSLNEERGKDVYF